MKAHNMKSLKIKTGSYGLFVKQNHTHTVSCMTLTYTPASHALPTAPKPTSL